MALMPPPKLRLSEWMEAEMRLPPEVSALPGPVRLYPFQRDIADAMSDAKYERVSVLKSARVGYSTLAVGCIANFVANDPTLVLAVLPTDEDARKLVVSDIEPIFAESLTLKTLLSGDLQENNRNTMLARRFPGGTLKVVAAKAPRNLRAHTARVLILDETDGMEVTKEGYAPDLAEKRTLTFPDRKIITGSTPVFEETSQIIRAYGMSDQRIYEVPCPECGDLHEIMWKDIQWPDGRPGEAHWCCPSCGSVVEEKHKTAMVAAGRWRATKPEVEGHAGFRLNSLISPLANARWGVLAKEFLQKKDDPSSLQAFVNTILGEGWRGSGPDIDDQELASRAQAFGLNDMPDCVMTITAGVDVQHDRLETTFVGWAESGASYILGSDVIWGQWHEDVTWSQLDVLLASKWPHPLGGEIGVDATCVDSSDGTTMETVYKFCVPRFRRRIMAIKGVSGSRPWIERSKSKSASGRLWIVGVDSIKRALIDRVRGGDLVRFSRDLPAVWFEQFASERLVVRYNRGQPVAHFERIPGRAAETLDCTVYAFAARQVLTVNWGQRREALSGAPAPAPQVERKSQNSWLGGRRDGWLRR